MEKDINKDDVIERDININDIIDNYYENTPLIDTNEESSEKYKGQTEWQNTLWRWEWLLLSRIKERKIRLNIEVLFHDRLYNTGVNSWGV